MPDYNKFIAWALEKPKSRCVEIKVGYGSANNVEIWVGDSETGASGFVKSFEEIDGLKERTRRRELAEYERLKAKFEPATIEARLCDNCQYNSDCPTGDAYGYDADGNPVDDKTCWFYRENVAS